MEKEHARAGSDVKDRFEDILLRIDAGTDDAAAQFASLSLAIQESSITQEPTADEKIALRVKVVFKGSNEGAAPQGVTIAKATLLTLKGKMDLLVKGSKGEPFSRTFDPATPKMFEYGGVLPPRFPSGTRAILVFELESGGDPKAKKAIRSAVIVIAKKT